MQELVKNAIRSEICSCKISFADLLKRVEQTCRYLSDSIRSTSQITRIKYLSIIAGILFIVFWHSDNATTEYWLRHADIPLHLHETIIFLSLALMAGVIFEIAALLFAQLRKKRADWIISPITKVYIAAFFSAVIFSASECCEGAGKIIAMFLSLAILLVASAYSMLKLWE